MIITSLIYTIGSTIVSKLIIAFLNAIYYQNILEQECMKRLKYMKKAFKKTYSNSIYEYQDRCKNALIKAKVINSLNKLLSNTKIKIKKPQKKKQINKEINSIENGRSS